MEEGDCDYRIFGYMVNEGEDVDGEERLDIPPCYRSTEQYRASLGHKCNHSFSPNCYFSQYLHPPLLWSPALYIYIDGLISSSLTLAMIINKKS